MTFIEKAKVWLAETGLSNLGWIGGFAVSAFAGWWFIAGGTLGIFLYTNWNVLRKIAEDLTNKDGEGSETQ